MAQIGEEGEHPRPNPWETVSTIQGSQPQNHSEEWGKSLINDTKWKSDGWDTSSGQKDNKWKSDRHDTFSGRKEPTPHTRNRFSRCNRSRNVRSPKSPQGDLRQLIDRGANRHEESLSPAHCGRNAPRGKRGEPSGWKQTGHLASADPHFNETNWVEKHPGNELSDVKRHSGWDLHSLPRAQSRPRSSSPFYQAAHEVKKSDIEKESDGWGLSSSHVNQSRQRSLSPWSQAANNTNEKSDSKGTDGWGTWDTALHQPDRDAWNQGKSSDLYPNFGSNRGRDGHSASRQRDISMATEGKWKRTEWDRRYSPEHKWRRTGQHQERSRCSEHGVSSENRPSRTEWARGRSRGRERSGLRSLSRSEGKRSTDINNTKDEREKKLGFSSPKRNCSDLNKEPEFDGQNASQKEPDGWGENSSPVKTSRSRSMSPWSQAAFDINKNYNNKETDGWGTAPDRTANDAWNEPRSNFSPDHGFKRQLFAGRLQKFSRYRNCIQHFGMKRMGGWES